jgi:hypothetical protein
MSLSKIRLELARCKEYPEGAHDIGYEFAAPLTADSRIDGDELAQGPGPLPRPPLPT